jgi:Right handed beta helix region
MRKIVQIASLLAGAAVLGGVAMPTWAVDGVVLIDQNKAMAGNITPGDTPGFPVTISLPGSYRLASNLTVPNSSTNAIVIAADNVTLDLNGFSILGPTDCSGGLNPCANAVSDPNMVVGFGISTANLFAGGGLQFNITIRNGTIQGMGNQGIFLEGDSHLVEYMHVRSNGWGGIDIGEGPDRGGSIVQHNTAERNGGYGISIVEGLVSHNSVAFNTNGIFVFAGSASYNFVTRHGTSIDSFGLLLSPESSYIGNVLNRNSRNVAGGVNLGQNLCDSAACPGGHL